MPPRRPEDVRCADCGVYDPRHLRAADRTLHDRALALAAAFRAGWAPLFGEGETYYGLHGAPPPAPAGGVAAGLRALQDPPPRGPETLAVGGVVLGRADVMERLARPLWDDPENYRLAKPWPRIVAPPYQSAKVRAGPRWPRAFATGCHGAALVVRVGWGEALEQTSLAASQGPAGEPWREVFVYRGALPGLFLALLYGRTVFPFASEVPSLEWGRRKREVYELRRSARGL